MRKEYVIESVETPGHYYFPGHDCLVVWSRAKKWDNSPDAFLEDAVRMGPMKITEYYVSTGFNTTLKIRKNG